MGVGDIKFTQTILLLKVMFLYANDNWKNWQGSLGKNDKAKIDRKSVKLDGKWKPDRHAHTGLMNTFVTGPEIFPACNFLPLQNPTRNEKWKATSIPMMQIENQISMFRVRDVQIQELPVRV